MPLLKSTSAPAFELPFLSVTGLAAPSLGARETCVWRLRIAPGAPGALHQVDHEEIFVALAGRALARVGEQTLELEPGDTLIVPARQDFSLANPGSEPFEAMAVLPVGGQATLPAGEPFSPPWTR
jgi:mannose-6-phosphate isomerase-like protein (cupin superfamily)